MTETVASTGDADTPSLTQQFYEMLLESQWWSADEIADYQREQLALLLQHARAQAPFYERRLDPAFRADGAIAWERWAELPLVRRSDMLNHRDAMQARELPPGHGPIGVLATSGSTGLPIQITVNSLFGVANNGLRWRLHGWQGLDWSEHVLSPMETSEGHLEKFPRGEFRKPWGPPWSPTAQKGRLIRLSRRADSPLVLDVLEETGARYLNCGPDMAHVNALDARRLGRDVRFDAVLSQGNIVRRVDRTIVEEVFGARIIEHYSSKEGGQMAHPCPAGRLHINVEGGLVEIVDEAGQPCRPGETGRIVVTPFYMTGQPLIRYEQGDRATVGQPCSCGRHSPTIEAIVGRNVPIFHHPDGRSASGLMPDETRALLGAAYWQVAQVAPDRYEFRYVPQDDTRAADEDAVRALFHRTYFAESDIRFRRMDRIPFSAGGKLIEYLNEWKPPGSGR